MHIAQLQAPMVVVDYFFYRKWLVAPLNIILYNVFSDSGGPGTYSIASKFDAELYGVEPWTYYFFNGFLNFNFVFALALLSIPVRVGST